MHTEKRLFRKTLKQSGYSITRQRLSLFETLQGHNSLAVWQLVTRLPDQDQATVYRNIKVFEELGIINRLQLGWHSKLELSDIFHHHHHHLTCLKCGKVIILKDNPILETEITRLSARRGFTPTDHQLEIRGLCSQCQ